MKLAVIDRYFRLAVLIKGIDGILEIIGGAILLVVPVSSLHSIVARYISYEADENPRDLVTQVLQHIDHSLTSNSQMIAALYLVVHGVIKAVLAYALIKRKYHYYPLIIAGLLLFLFYETYLIGVSHSIILTVFAALDVVIIWLTYMEYRGHKH